jgi:hypothetical protein
MKLLASTYENDAITGVEVDETGWDELVVRDAIAY